MKKRGEENPPSIHFVFDNSVSYHALLPLMTEARRRGFLVTSGNRSDIEADIGFYLEDEATPGPQNFTVRTINGLDQDHVVRPDYSQFFHTANWMSFDFGVLPGPRWMRGFESQSFSPRFGVEVTGWAKADNTLPLLSGTTIVLAPQLGSAEKVNQTVRAVEALRQTTPLNLLVKHWETSEYQKIYPWLITDELLEELDAAEKALPDWATAAPRTKNFMDCLPGAAAVVTDQSSVMYEALLVPVPSISVVDWKHACGECPGLQPSPDAVIATESADLAEALKKAVSGDEDVRQRTLFMAKDNFSFLGSAAKQTLDAIMSAYRLKMGKSSRV